MTSVQRAAKEQEFDRACGFFSKLPAGHPLEAKALRNLYTLAYQLEGWADKDITPWVSYCVESWVMGVPTTVRLRSDTCTCSCADSPASADAPEEGQVCLL